MTINLSHYSIAWLTSLTQHAESTGLTLATIRPTQVMYQTVITLVHIAIANLATILPRYGTHIKRATMKANHRLSIALIVEQELLSTNLERTTVPTNKTNIANQLVNAGTELDNMENATVEDAFDKINIIVNYSDEHDVFLPLFDRLAMLIDPVTNVVVETNENDDVEYIFCGGCGEEFSTDLFNEHEITHCPYCGCRFRNPRQN